MIDRGEIDSMAERLGVHSSYVQRDYVHSWLLAMLYSSSALADRLVLKGGNCLRKGYFENARYSRDLDFTTASSIPDETLGRELNALCRAIQERSGVEFDTARTRVEPKRRVDSDKTISEARLYFRDFYGRESELVLSVRLDVTQFDRIYLPVQSRRLIHPYSDSSTCKATIRCVKLEELLATKMRCLLQRRHIADLFDLVYAVLINREIEVARPELIRTFFKITIFEQSPGVAKGLLIDLPFETLRRFWTEHIVAPIQSRFSFDNARDSFVSLIESLISVPAIRERSDIFFPATLRAPIMEAAESLTALRLRYDGIDRLVEPYKLTYMIRRDGVGREYLFAYDTTGGQSSGPGMKTFVSEGVQSIENTTFRFEPRYDVELKKAGGAETIGHFEGRKTPGPGFSLVKKPVIRRARARKAGSWSGWGMEHVIVCPYCNRRFKRKTMDTRLKAHKDRYGNPCYGRIGYGM
jgi:predicted nucleotidyltransferase component of viral defense system